MRSPIRALRRALLSPGHDPVHFHLHHDGRPFVCDVSRCDSPQLTLDEIGARTSSAQG